MVTDSLVGIIPAVVAAGVVMKVADTTFGRVNNQKPARTNLRKAATQKGIILKKIVKASSMNAIGKVLDIAENLGAENFTIGKARNGILVTVSFSPGADTKEFRKIWARLN